MKRLVIIASFLSFGCATTNETANVMDPSYKSKLQKAVERKRNGDVLFCQGRHRRTMDCAYMDQWEMQNKLRNMGLY